MFQASGRSWKWSLAVALVALVIAPVSFAQTSSPCGPMDLVFVVDTTGSMGGTLQNIREDLANLITQIDRASGGDFRLGLVEFKDEVIVNDDLAAGNTTSVITNVLALTAGGGAGEPESSDEAMNTVLNGLDAADREAGKQTGDFKGRFRPEAAKIVILVTDARPAGFDDAYTEGVDDVVSLGHALTANAKGIRVSAIYVPTPFAQTNDEETIQRVLRQYSSTTGGRFIKANEDGTGTALAISNIVNSCGGATFYLGAEPALIELFEKEDGVFTVNTNAIGRFDSDIILSARNLPEGATVSFDPAIVTAPGTGTSRMTFRPGPLTLPGTHLIEIVGTSATDSRVSRTATVRVNIDCRPPFIYGTTDYQPASQTVPNGTSATLRVVPGGSSPYFYQWYEGATSDTLLPIPLATSPVYVTPPITEKREFWVRVTNACGNYDSWTAVVEPSGGSSDPARRLRRR